MKYFAVAALALAAFSHSASAQYPAKPVRIIVPTATESAVPGYDFANWGGMFAPAGTPLRCVPGVRNGPLESRAREQALSVTICAMSPQMLILFHP